MRLPNKLKIVLVKIDDEFDISPYLSWFNLETQQKILSYRFKADQVRSFTSELLKQYYLAKILELAPQSLNLDVDNNKRPYIANNHDLDFNVSHSGNYVGMAIVFTGKVGLDIEKIDVNVDIELIADMVLSPMEKKLAANGCEDFFVLWCKKEAWLKAKGTGFLSEDYAQSEFDVRQYQINQDGQSYWHKLADDYILSVCVLDN